MLISWRVLTGAYCDEHSFSQPGWPFSLLNDKQRVATGWGLNTCKSMTTSVCGTILTSHVQVTSLTFPCRFN